MTDEVVTRLYRALVHELRRRGHDPDRPVKVAALYRDLVPYKAVRSTIGVELNADYEHALLRLLAGERDLLRLEPAEARAELRREVESPYPFVGLFRKYSTSKVWVSMPAGLTVPPSEERAERTPADESGPRLVADRGRGSVASRGGAAAERAPIPLHAEDRSPARRLDPSERRVHAGEACGFCGEGLPEGRRVRFCPHCGGDQRLRPCPRCDAVLERGWTYCISCGHGAGGD